MAVEGLFSTLGRAVFRCRYYFEMSHLIPNLKYQIERVFSQYLQVGDSNENMSDFGG